MSRALACWLKTLRSVNMFEQFNLVLAVKELIDDGGPFIYGIFGTGVLMWALIMERYLYFSTVLPTVRKQTVSRWNARPDHTSWCARQIRQMMISKVNAAMTYGFP